VLEKKKKEKEREREREVTTADALDHRGIDYRHSINGDDMDTSRFSFFCFSIERGSSLARRDRVSMSSSTRQTCDSFFSLLCSGDRGR